MSLISNECVKVAYKELKQQLEIEVENQFKLLKHEKLQRLQKIGYVRPRTRLQQLHADEYMTDKQFANILGLGQIVKNNPELSNEFLQGFIKHYRFSLRYLNHVLKVVPDTVDLIRTYGENKVVFTLVRTLEKSRQKI